MTRAERPSCWSSGAATAEASHPARRGRRGLGALLLGGGVGAREPAAGGRLLRVDPATDRVTARIPLPGGHPKAVGAGEGGIWVAGYRDRQDRPGGVIEHAPVLWRVDPRTSQVVSSLAPPGRPVALMGSDASPPAVLASRGAVFVSDPPTGVVWQVDPRRHRFVGSMAISQGGPLAAAAGVVWAGGANSLVPLTGPDAGGYGPRLRDPLGRWITGLAASADTLWVATSDALYRVDPRGLARTHRRLVVG